MQQSSLKHKFIGFLLLAIAAFGNISTFAQKRGAPSQTQTASKDSKSQTCNSGYVGTLNYTKTVQTSSSGRYGSYTNMKRTYQATISVRDDGRQQGSVMSSGGVLSGSFNLNGQSTASVTEIDDRLDVSEKEDYCKLTLKGAEGKTRVHCESKFNRTQNATGTTGDANIFLGIQGNKMRISIGNLPQLNGTMNETSSSKCSGTCGKDTPINSSRTGEVKGAGERSVMTEEDKITFDPNNFNRLSGSWSKSEPTPGGTVTESMTWNFSRCAPPLEIDNLRFEQKQVQSPNNWIGVDSLTGAYDGNIVKIKATVFNNGGDTAYANVKFAETKSGETLPDSTVSVQVKPGESREVEYEWDTSGYAWSENQTKESDREIKATLEGGNSKTEKIKILPKPVILVHGLWSNAAAWAEWHSYLREKHSFAWEAFPVGEDINHGKMNTGDYAGNWNPTNSIFQNAQELGKQIKWVREQKNAWHVDLVVHSMGGLISRFYIHNFMAPVYDGKPEATHLVMLGTPNQGSACADLMYGVYNTGFDKPVEALRQLKPSVVEEYNKKTYNRKNVKFSILAGFGAGPTCGLEIGDGVVPLSSALYNISDRGYAGTHHLALTEKNYFESFVVPRIAIGPKKAKAEQATAELDMPFTKDGLIDKDFEDDDRYGYAKYFRNASYKNEQSADDANEPKNLTKRMEVQLAPKETKEIEIPVRDGSSAGIVLLTMPYISATLTDANGAVVGTSSVNTGGLLNYLRTIAVQREIKNGVWKLKLENTANLATSVIVAGFTNSGTALNFTVDAGKAAANGTIPLVAKLSENNMPVLNAKITGNIVGQGTEIVFFDDGKHGDGAEGDGIYGASVEKLGAGDYFIEAKAEINKQIRMAIAEIKTGAVTPAKPSGPVKSAATRRRGK